MTGCIFFLPKIYNQRRNINIDHLPELREAALGLLEPLLTHGVLVIEVGVGVVAVVLGNLIGLAMAGIGFDFGGLICRENGTTLLSNSFLAKQVTAIGNLRQPCRTERGLGHKGKRSNRISG